MSARCPVAWAAPAPEPAAFAAHPSPGSGQLERIAIEAAPDGILMVDRQGRILMANAATELITGHPPASLCGQPLSTLLPPELRERHSRLMEHYFARPVARPMGMLGHLRLHQKGGGTVPVDVALGYSEAHGGGAVVFIRDVSEMRRMEEHLHYQATHDSLTGLINRWQFGQRLAQAIAQSQRHGRPMALLLLDLNDFKAINDGLGHAAGDQALLEAARRLKSVLRASDALARIGGDEFTVLLPELQHPEDASQVARKLQAVLQRPCTIHNCHVQLSASIGMAVYPDHAQDADTLMRYADMAMYHAKARGTEAHAVYAPQMGQRMEEKLHLGERLRQAMTRGDLRLHYQPQVSVASGEVVGVEALLRWTDPELGEVPPARFIPVAEATGLIVALGDWVLDTACRQIALWHRQGWPLRVAVNLSAQQLRQASLAARLQQCLDDSGAPPQLLELEITESEAMADPEQARLLLQRFQAMGVKVSLDDFGTGHSALAYLQRLPIERIKIDREFIRQMQHAEGDQRLVQAVIALGQTLGLEVVAEGVEEPEQLALLRHFGCSTYQGWLFARAMPAEQLQALRSPAA